MNSRSDSNLDECLERRRRKKGWARLLNGNEKGQDENNKSCKSALKRSKKEKRKLFGKKNIF